MASYFTSALVYLFFLKCSFVLISTTERELPTVGTKNVTAHYCPHPCIVNNNTFCYPPPCPFPPCIDPTKDKPTDCCEYCPDGANCKGPDGRPIKLNHWKIVDGKNCTCKDFANDATCV